VDYPITHGTYRTPNGRLVTMAFRQNTNDHNTLNASMTEDEYGFRGRSVSGHAVDVGGYLGSVGIGMALDNPDLRVTIVEPVPGNAELIRRNIALNELEDRVSLIEGACSGDRDPVTVWFGYRGNETAEHHAFVGNSTLAYDDSGELAHETVTYDPITLADLAPIDFLKIDCEGGEWSILPGTTVPVIVGEAHSVRGHKGDDIIDLLPDHEVTVTYSPADPEHTGTVEFTAVLR
jgi:FkbM family methyltransferase